jgi:hypothetical protein
MNAYRKYKLALQFFTAIALAIRFKRQIQFILKNSFLPQLNNFVSYGGNDKYFILAISGIFYIFVAEMNYDHCRKK